MNAIPDHLATQVKLTSQGRFGVAARSHAAPDLVDSVIAERLHQLDDSVVASCLSLALRIQYT